MMFLYILLPWDEVLTPGLTYLLLLTHSTPLLSLLCENDNLLLYKHYTTKNSYFME